LKGYIIPPQIKLCIKTEAILTTLYYFICNTKSTLWINYRPTLEVNHAEAETRVRIITMQEYTQ